MQKDRKQKKIQWQQYIGIAFFILIGAICGVLIVNHLDSSSASDGNRGEYLIRFALMIVGMYVALFMQIVIHESGHLVFGLLTGYDYSSFRVGSFMWIKECGKLKFKKLSIAGMGGQCLMIPPEMSDGKIPFILYNLGGSLMNILVGLIFGFLYLLLGDVQYISVFFLMASFIGFAFALLNGVPMRLGSVNNDGYNILSLRKNNHALRSFWIQMKIAGELARGIRLKDMPEEWFETPSADEMKNSITACIGVFASNRMMDNHSFEKADQLINKLLKEDSAIVGLHRKLMTCDKIYYELISENRQDLLDTMLDKNQKKFLKVMKKFPSVLRTEYAYALLAEKNIEKAVKIKTQFEKNAHAYPYPSDIESEHELIEIADSVAKNKSII